MNYGVIAPGDHWILIRCGLHHPMQTVPPNHRAEISVRCRGRYHLPGCFPTGETTSAQSVDNGILNIFNGIWRYHVGTWYIAARCAARFPMGIAGRLSAARLFPLLGNNVGAKRRQCNTNILPLKFRGIMSKHGILATLLHYRANTVLLKNLPRWRADTIRYIMV